MTHEPHIVPSRLDVERMDDQERYCGQCRELGREVKRLRDQLLGATACAFGRVLDGEGIAHTPVSDAACRAALDLCEEANCQLRDELAEARREIERLKARLQAANAEVIEASEQAARDAEAANDMMQQLAECRRLLREAVECDPDVYWLSRDWHKQAAKAGGDDE